MWFFLSKCIQKSLEFTAIVSENSLKPPRIPMPIKWLKPALGGVKLNTNGAANSSLGRVGVCVLGGGGGGLLRDSEGNWLGGFAHSMGSCSSLLVELWALKDELLLANSLGFSTIFIEVDVEMVVFLLKNHITINLVIEPLLSDCKNLLLIFTNPVVKHVFRETNQYADILANLGLTLDCPFQYFSNPPSMVANLLAFDKAELFGIRMVCS